MLGCLIQTARPNSAEQAAAQGKVEKKMLLNSYFQIYPQLAGIERNPYRKYTASSSSCTFSTWQSIRQVSPVEIQLIQGPSSKIPSNCHTYMYMYIGQESRNNPSVVSHSVVYFNLASFSVSLNITSLGNHTPLPVLFC